MPPPKKRYGLFALAVTLLLSGVVVNIIYFNDFPRRSLGLLMCVVGALLIRISNVRSLKGARITNRPNLNPRVHKRLGRLAWVLSVASAMAIGIFYIYLRKDALAGGHEVWPAYAFAVSALIAAVVWGYVVSKFLDP